MAAVPITTRATPSVGERAAAASALRTPPPGLHRHVDRRGDGARSGPGSTGSPVRAASRSTVWIHGAPGRDERLGHRHRVVAVDALAIEVALGELHDLAAAEVDRRVEVHQVATRAAARSTKAGGRRGRCGSTSPGGTASPTRSPCADRRHHRAAVVAGGDHDARPRCRPRRSARSTPRPGRGRGAGARGRPAARAGSTASAVASRRPGASRTVPGRMPRPVAPGLSSEASNSICMPMQMPRNGTPALDRLVGERVEAGARARASMQRPKAPTPGSTTPSASRIRPGSAVSRASAPRCWSAFWADRRLPIS